MRQNHLFRYSRVKGKSWIVVSDFQTLYSPGGLVKNLTPRVSNSGTLGMAPRDLSFERISKWCWWLKDYLWRTTGLSHYFLTFRTLPNLDKWILPLRRGQASGPLSLLEDLGDQYLDLSVNHSQHKHTLSVIDSGSAHGPLSDQLSWNMRYRWWILGKSSLLWKI